jgi:hypothetical protein
MKENSKIIKKDGNMQTFDLAVQTLGIAEDVSEAFVR